MSPTLHLILWSLNLWQLRISMAISYTNEKKSFRKQILLPKPDNTILKSSKNPTRIMKTSNTFEGQRQEKQIFNQTILFSPSNNWHEKCNQLKVKSICKTTNIALSFPRSEVHRELQQCLTSIPTNFVRNLSNLEKQMFCVTSNQNI